MLTFIGWIAIAFGAGMVIVTLITANQSRSLFETDPAYARALVILCLVAGVALIVCGVTIVKLS